MAALEHQIEGTVTIRYTIDHKGNVIQTKVLAGIGHGCDEEAARIISLLKFNVPATRKVKVQFQKTTHIHFKLSIHAPKKPTINYEINSPGKKPTYQEKPKSYHYQIKW